MNQITYMQISSAQGPLECELAAERTLKEIIKDAKKQNIKLEIVERLPSAHFKGLKSIKEAKKLDISSETLEKALSAQPQGLKSVLLKLTGDGVALFGKSWAGTILWQFTSPIRPKHPRKNWFVGVFLLEVPTLNFDLKEIRIDTMRAQGAGGQHVNKTESAVRITHLPTGISVVCQSERSQHSNKKEALNLLSYKIKEYELKLQQKEDSKRWHQHYEVERGNPIRTFKA